MTWSATQYTAFEYERTRPVRDLLAAVPEFTPPGRAIDIGCGPGNSTEVLASRFPGAAVSGIDSSPDMIEAARSRLPHIRFDIENIQTWSDPGRFQLILANAVLQWVPEHARLLPRLIAHLGDGGALAIQMPDNLDGPAHRLMRETAAEGPWASKLAAVSQARTPIADAEWYYSLLKSSCGRVDVWRTIYHHPLPGGPSAIVEWFKGSGLRPFIEPLDESERAAYLERYTAAIAQSYRTFDDGSVLLPFPRLFMVAIR
jgi:trans-aconitate 2-methyltransferase